MNPADAPGDDDQLGALLAAYHEALTAVQAPPPLDAPGTPPQDRAQLTGLQACLRRLEADRLRNSSAVPRFDTQPLVFDPRTATGQIDRFRLVRELGRGGSGVVFLAFDPELGRPVALKVPRPEVLLTPELRQRFQREAQAAAGLHHPNLVTLYQVGEVNSICFLVSEFCPGPTLAAWLKQQSAQVPPRQAAEIVAALADGVAHMHAGGVLHRDLKPANILLGKDEGGRMKDELDSSFILPPASLVPKITDFGLAKVLEAETLNTRSGALVGTPAYMPPEQANGRVKAIGPQTDVYGLGVILYELLTAQVPFQGATDFLTLQQIVTAEPPAPRLLRPGLPRDLETICLKCLAKQPSRRYASAQALADDLRSYLAGRAIQARPARAAEKLVKWCRLRPRVSLAAALLVIATLAGFSVYEGLSRLEANRLEADHLVRKLTTADTSEVLPILAELRPYHRWAEPRLRRLAEEGATSKERLHARLALISDYVNDLVDYLLVAPMDEVPVLIESLKEHQDKFLKQFWEELFDHHADAGRRLRAGCALAAYEPRHPFWSQMGGDLVRMLLKENPSVLPLWATAFRPVLGQWCAELLVERLLDADPPGFAQVMVLLQGCRGAAVPLLQKQLDQAVAADETSKERIAKQQARAGVALYQLGSPGQVWPMLRYSDNDPRRRSYLIHWLAALGAKPTELLRRLETEGDVTAKRALLLSLGEYGKEGLMTAERERLREPLLKMYHDDPDPGLHAAAAWLLGQWGQKDKLKEIDKELATGEMVGQRRWYVTQQGQTFIVLTNWVRRTFAIAAAHVTVEQFLSFRPKFRDVLRKHCPEPDCPMMGISWYEAAEYCNWLSKKEGLPEKEWCYLPNEFDDFKSGMRMAPDYLRRKGYRLPTEAEYEYACRAGAATRHFFGQTDDLVDKYAYYRHNSKNRTWPAGILKPNDFGIFGMQGMLWTWCQDRYQANPMIKGGKAMDDTEENGSVEDREERVSRGGAFSVELFELHCAVRGRDKPSVWNYSSGVRPVRTLDAR